MNAERDASEGELEQDPGSPGTAAPEKLPPHDESKPEQVPDSEQPDVDDEGHMAPNPPEPDPD
jgi:hypothetical protein